MLSEVLKNIKITLGKKGNKKPMTAKEKWMLFLLAGLLLAVIIFPTGKKENNILNDITQASGQKHAISENMSGSTGMSLSQYEVYLSEQLENILSKMDGVGKVQAWVTISASNEKVLAREKDSEENLLQEADSVGGTRREKRKNVDETIIKGNNGEPYVVKTLQPQIEGVFVVAEGADNGVIKKNISEAVEVLFGIDAHRIKVAKKKMEE